MLVKNEQVLVIVKGAHDEAFVELADDPQSLEIALAKHPAKLIVSDHDVIGGLSGCILHWGIAVTLEPKPGERPHVGGSVVEAKREVFGAAWLLHQLCVAVEHAVASNLFLFIICLDIAEVFIAIDALAFKIVERMRVGNLTLLYRLPLVERKLS